MERVKEMRRENTRVLVWHEAVLGIIKEMKEGVRKI